MMKAKKMYLIVFLIALIALTPCFSACKKKEQETIKKDSALVKNAYEIYKEDTSKLQVKPKYQSKVLTMMKNQQQMLQQL